MFCNDHMHCTGGHFVSGASECTFFLKSFYLCVEVTLRTSKVVLKCPHDVIICVASG